MMTLQSIWGNLSIMLENKLIKSVLVSIILFCQFFAVTFAQVPKTSEIQCCNKEKTIYDGNCTYLKKTIEQEVVKDAAEDELPTDIISTAIQQSFSTTTNFVYFCMLPISIATAPFALIAVWITMFYAIHTNDELKVFR